ncbi:transposase [Mannheimia sp. HC-2023]
MKAYSPKRQARKPIRLKYYDYRSQGYYFITICCKDKQCFFGKVVGREMKLNRVGEIVHKEWLNTEKIRKNIQLHEFVVMPNHFHAILEITESLDNNNVGANSNCPIIHRVS